MQEKKELDIGISKYAREKIIEHLKYSFTHDYLEQADFEKRLNIAVNTQNRGDLKTLVEDLPEAKEEPESTQEIGPAVSINKGTVKEKSVIVAIFSGTEKKGLWKPPKRLDLFVTMGGVELDFTTAVFPPGVTEINVFCLMGGVEITIPHGVNVDNQCISILGGVEDESILSEYTHSPTIKIQGLVVLGGLEIKTPKEGLMKRILKKLGIE
jgi:hypothetical protein